MSGVNSVVSHRNIQFYANQTPQERAKVLADITRNNPNIKIDPAAYNALMKEGSTASANIEERAPERRNLYIGAFASIAQLIGGLNGAAYTDELGSAIMDRIKGDAGFVAKHGNNYKLDPFGGASVQEGTITVSSINNPVANPAADPIKIADQEHTQAVKAQASVNQVQIVKPGSPESTRIGQLDKAVLNAKHSATGETNQETVGTNQTKGAATGERTGNDNFMDYAKAAGLKKGSVNLAQQGSVVNSVLIYGSDKGNPINYLTGTDLVDAKGKKTYGADGVIADRISSAQNFIQKGVNAGLIDQKQLNDAGKDPVKLLNLFKETEAKLTILAAAREGKISVPGASDSVTTIDAIAKLNGKDLNNTFNKAKASLGETLFEGKFGNHHLQSIQALLSDRLQSNQGGAFALTELVSGRSTAGLNNDQKAAALKAFNQANPGATVSSFAELEKRLSDPTTKNATLQGIKGAFDRIENAQKDVIFGLAGKDGNRKGGLVNSQNGAFLTGNAVLAANINATGLFNPSSLKGKPGDLLRGQGVADASKKGGDGQDTTGNLHAQIGSVKDFIDRKIAGADTATGATSAQVGGTAVSVEIGGKKIGPTDATATKDTSASISDQVKAVKDELSTSGPIEAGSIKSIKDAFNQALANKGAGVTDADRAAVKDLFNALDAKNGTTITSAKESGNSAQTANDIASVKKYLQSANNQTSVGSERASAAVGTIKENLGKQIDSVLSSAGINTSSIKGTDGKIDFDKAKDLFNKNSASLGSVGEGIKANLTTLEGLSIPSKISNVTASASAVASAKNDAAATAAVSTVTNPEDKKAVSTSSGATAAIAQVTDGKGTTAKSETPTNKTATGFTKLEEGLTGAVNEGAEKLIAADPKIKSRLLSIDPTTGHALEGQYDPSKVLNALDKKSNTDPSFKEAADKIRNLINKDNYRPEQSAYQKLANYEGIKGNLDQKLDDYFRQNKIDPEKLKVKRGESVEFDYEKVKEAIHKIGGDSPEAKNLIKEVGDFQKLRNLAALKKLSDTLTNLAGDLFSIADDLLQKLATRLSDDGAFDYGFYGSSNGSNGSGDGSGDGSNNTTRNGRITAGAEVGATFNLGRTAGAGVENGLSKIEEYANNRREEARKDPISLQEANRRSRIGNSKTALAEEDLYKGHDQASTTAGNKILSLFGAGTANKTEPVANISEQETKKQVEPITGTSVSP